MLICIKNGINNEKNKISNVVNFKNSCKKIVILVNLIYNEEQWIECQMYY